MPVVATEFPHAVELLADGPGLLVPHQDPEAMAAGIRHLITTPEGTGRRTGLGAGPTLRWPAVAAGTTLFLIPICVFTILLRKHLLRGITFGAVRK